MTAEKLTASSVDFFLMLNCAVLHVLQQFPQAMTNCRC